MTYTSPSNMAGVDGDISDPASLDPESLGFMCGVKGLPRFSSHIVNHSGRSDQVVDIQLLMSVSSQLRVRRYLGLFLRRTDSL